MAQVKIQIKQNLESGGGIIQVDIPDFSVCYTFENMKSCGTRGSQIVDKDSFVEHIPDPDVVYQIELGGVHLFKG